MVTVSFSFFAKHTVHLNTHFTLTFYRKASFPKMIFHEKQHGFCARLFLSARTLGTEIGKEIRNIPTTSQTLENFRVFFLKTSKTRLSRFFSRFSYGVVCGSFFPVSEQAFPRENTKTRNWKNGRTQSQRSGARTNTHTHRTEKGKQTAQRREADLATARGKL